MLATNSNKLTTNQEREPEREKLDSSKFLEVASMFKEKIEWILKRMETINLTEEEKNTLLRNSVYVNLLFYFWFLTPSIRRINSRKKGFLGSALVYSCCNTSSYSWWDDIKKLTNYIKRHRKSLSSKAISALEGGRIKVMDILDKELLKQASRLAYEVYMDSLRK